MSQFPQLNFNHLISQVHQFLKSGLAGNVPSNLPDTPLGNPALPQQSILREPRLPLSALFQNESLRLNPREISQFLKESMKLPQEIRLTLLMLALESSPQEIQSQLDQGLRQLLEQNLNQLSIPVDELQALLGKNTQEAQEKMMKLLQASSQTQSGQQIAELMVTLGKLGDKIKASPQDAMETLMLLYIPWYPLTSQQKLELSFEMGEGSGEDGEKDVSAIVYLETNTFGRFKIVVMEVDRLQVLVKIYHEQHARDLMPILEEELNNMLAQDGLPAAMFDTETIRPEQMDEVIPPPGSASQGEAVNPPGPASEPEKPQYDGTTAGFKRATRQPDRKQITIQPGEHISLLVMQCAYFLARLIFEADEASRLLQK